MEGKQHYLADIILHLVNKSPQRLIKLIALTLGATKTEAIFEHFPGLFCHKFTICRILKPLILELFGLSYRCNEGKK